MFAQILKQLTLANKALDTQVLEKFKEKLNAYKKAEDELFELYNKIEGFRATKLPSGTLATEAEITQGKYDKVASNVAKQQQSLVNQFTKLTKAVSDLSDKLPKEGPAAKTGAFLE